MSAWVCAICGQAFFQSEGWQPQTHKEGCADIRPGDHVVSSENAAGRVAPAPESR